MISCVFQVLSSIACFLIFSVFVLERSQLSTYIESKLPAKNCVLSLKVAAYFGERMAEENGARVLRKEMSDGGNHHVHFPETDDVATNDEIIVQSAGKDSYNVHVGFLQHLHRYALTFVVPDREASSDLETNDQGVPNINCKLVKAEKAEKGLQLVVEFFAHKDKLLKEKITLQDKSRNGKLIHLEFSARVLGQGKGTPMLKEGVRCLGAERNEEDEGAGSDWQGF